ncbi:hypothetical protein JCM8547_006661 [Rhodosporidiobolus lusitaniae]
MSTADSDFAAQAALQTMRDNILQPIVIAGFLSCCLCGVLVCLVVTYFSRFPHDLMAYKALVAVLTVISLVDTAIQCDWMYTFCVKYFMQPEMLGAWPWQFTSYIILTGLSVSIAQLFFVWRVFVISSQTAYVLCGFITLVIAGALACDLRVFIFGTTAKTFADFQAVVDFSWAWLSCGAFADVWLTASIVYFIIFKPRRERYGGETPNSSSPLMRIVIHTCESNAVSLFVQTVLLILLGLSSRWGSLHYLIPAWIESKTYSLAVITTLNARRTTNSGAAYPSSNDHSSRSKGLGARPGRGGQQQQPTNSVHVLVEQEIEVDGLGGVEEDAYPGSGGGRDGILERYRVQFAKRQEGELERAESFGSEEKGRVSEY